MSKRFTFAAAAAVLFGQAVAGQPAYAQSADQDDPHYSEYFRSLRMPHQPDSYCCTEADCRSVDSRFVDGHWEVFISRKVFGKDHGTDTWVSVPAELTVPYSRGKIPRPDKATACYYNFYLRCFDPPNLAY